MKPRIARKSLLSYVQGRYLRWTAYGLFFLVLFLLQMSPHGLPAIWGVRPWPLVLLVVSAAMFEGPVGGAALGLISGLAWDMYSARPYGGRALVLMAVGCACGLLVRLLIRNNLLSALLLMGASVLLFGLGDWLLIYVLFGESQPLTVLWRLVLPRMGYTFVFSPVIYYVNYGCVRLLHERL